MSLFNNLEQPPADKILSLMSKFKQDPRAEKIDLGIGVYKNADGQTPIFEAVRAAEQELFASETTKSYLSPAGDPGFCEAALSLAFGDDAPHDRLRAMQTPGGAGALRVLAGLADYAAPGTTVHLPIPTWINHHSVMEHAGLQIRQYRYLDSATNRIDFDAMMADLGKIDAGDLVLLHGCCHNPSGADLDRTQWQSIADLVTARGLIPFIDLAYQGFGDGLDEDGCAIRLLAAQVPDMIVAYSCSKNFGIYRERTGAAFVLRPTSAQADIAIAQLSRQARLTYSMPPDHGASVVRIILGDPALSQNWRDELDSMRLGIASLRHDLCEAFREFTNGAHYDFLAEQKGMFSLLDVSPDEAVRLREEFGIYVVEDGRINIAGLGQHQIRPFAQAVCSL